MKKPFATAYDAIKKTVKESIWKKEDIEGKG